MFVVCASRVQRQGVFCRPPTSRKLIRIHRPGPRSPTRPGRCACINIARDATHETPKAPSGQGKRGRARSRCGPTDPRPVGRVGRLGRQVPREAGGMSGGRVVGRLRVFVVYLVGGRKPLHDRRQVHEKYWLAELSEFVGFGPWLSPDRTDLDGLRKRNL